MLFERVTEEVREIADATISIHDRHRFEVKLDIELAESGRAGYRVDTYFFVPRALNVNPTTFSKERFYSSIQRYVRFKTPPFALPEIVDPANAASPLVRTRTLLRQIVAGPEVAGLVESVFSEIKLLGAVSRAAIRDAVRDLLGRLSEVPPESDPTSSIGEAVGRMDRFLAELDEYLAAIQLLRRDLLAPGVPVKLREAYLFYDEFISLTIEDYLSTLLHAIRGQPGRAGSLASLDARAASVISSQQAHRSSMGYPSVLSSGSNGGADSTLLYRRGVLKKFISNVLYLQTELSEWEGLSQISLAVAAGFAMLVAAVATVFAQNRYTTNSIPFVLVVVASYMFKDRLKDWLKLYLARGMVRWTADRKIRIRDPHSGRVIGTLKEAFGFTDETRVPPDVLRCRQMDNITSVDEEGKPERIIKYEKQVTLYPERISRFHQRRRDLNDIMRLNIDDFLRQADDPVVDYLHLDGDTGQLRQVQCQRVYHLNMVFAYRSTDRSGHAAERVERFRLVVNRDGIVSLEPVAPREA
jgi:hypothetical protein